MRKAASLPIAPAIKKDITVEQAVKLYLIKRSGKAQHPDGACYRDRWLLRDGSKRQPSLLQWAKANGFNKLTDITSVDVERWRNTWVFRAESYSPKVHNAAIKAFFTWCVRVGEYLEKNPFDKLDKLTLKAVPTRPLSPTEYTRLLAAAETSPHRAEALVCLIQLERWSGLANLDACTLRRSALTAENTIRAYRKKSIKKKRGWMVGFM
jgi:integrase